MPDREVSETKAVLDTMREAFIPDMRLRLDLPGVLTVSPYRFDGSLKPYRISPRWGIFSGVETIWRIAETTPRGEFIRAVYWCDDYAEVLAQQKLLSRAEALETV